MNEGIIILKDRTKQRSIRSCQTDIDIIQLMSEGKSNRQIVKILFLSYGAVRNRIENMLMIFDCANATHLVAKTIRKSFII